MSNIRNRGSVRVAPHVTDPSLQAKSQTEQLLAELGEDDIPTPEPLEQPQPQQSNMLVIVFVLIIIALVAIIIWLFTKGNNQEKEKEEEVLRRLSADPRRRWAANQYASPNDSRNQYASPNQYDQRNQSHQLTRQQGMHPSQMQVPEWSNEQAQQQAQHQQAQLQQQQAQLQAQQQQAQQQAQQQQAQQPKPAQPSPPAQQAQPVLTSPLMENKGPSVDEVLQQTAPVNLNKIDQEMLSAVAAERIAAAEETN